MSLLGKKTVRSDYNHFNQPRHLKTSGLTLIEVLIALAIVSIALTSIIKATSQNIRATAYLQDKMVATWVASLVMSEIEVGVKKIAADTALNDKTLMLGKTWYFKATLSATPNRRIQKIVVTVYSTLQDREEEEGSPLYQLESYRYHAT